MRKNIDFKNRLNQSMYKKKLRQVDLVEYTGIPSSAITMYCNGKYLPKAKNLKLIAKVLEVSEDWLLGIENDETMIIQIYRKLPKNKKKILLKEAIKILNSN